MPLEEGTIRTYESLSCIKSSAFHSSIKPFLRSDLMHSIDVDSVENSLDLIYKINKRISQNDSLSKSKNDTFSYRFIEVSPLFFLHSGYENGDTERAFSGSAIGAMVNASFGKKVFFSADFTTANSGFPNFIQQFADSTGVVPSSAHSFSTKAGSHYKTFSGYFSYSPSHFFNFQLGHGKNFWGEGYRSLLLSDVAPNYSYFKITSGFWKIKYVNLFANFKDVRQPYKDYWHFKNKFGTFHYLSWHISPSIDAGLFESVIWQAKDTLNSRGYDVNYLNPVIFYRPVEYSLGSADNSLIGLNLRFKITNHFQVYSQLIVDEFLVKEVRANNGWWANKYGGQLGFKYFDAFGLKGFFLQSEFNEVRPYTYSHGSTLQNYAHFNQPLAHPLGANFSEVLGIMRYTVRNFSFEIKSVISRQGTDSAGKNFGGDIYQSYNSIPQQYGNKTGQGVSTVLMFNEANASFLIYPKLNLKIEIGALSRTKYVQNHSFHTLYFWAGIKTSLYNLYRDFM